MQRRQLLKAGLALGALAATPLARAGKGRVVIVGGGWGGLAAARQLRQLAPALEVVLLERNAEFRSLPLSNRWLVGLAGNTPLVFDYAATAGRHGYRFLRAEVIAIDRTRRQVVTRDETLDYDWLVLAAGIREDFTGWFGDDVAATRHTQQHFGSAFTGGDELLRLKARLENFTGGDLVMTIPPMPYRCPPAPYERAVMLAWWLKEKRIKGRLLVLDPNQPALAFDRVFRDSYSEQISYFPQARINTLDPYKKRLTTDFETIDFADAILAPPQQAADIAWQAGLVGHGKDGKASGWAAQDPVHLHVPGDERVFLVGDLVDKASPLFGFYPKTGQIAARQGAIAAQEIAARAAGLAPGQSLPSSSCYVVRRVSPLEISRIDTDFRFRADGLIQQTVKQTLFAQAEDEDRRWASAMFGELGL